MSRWALVLVLVLGCSKGGMLSDGSVDHPDAHLDPLRDLATQADDLQHAAEDLGSADLLTVDQRGTDAAMSADLKPAPDLSVPADLKPPPDLAVPGDLATPPDLAYPVSQTVDIFVDNTCKMDVLPKKFDVPAGSSLKLTYVNRSRDYKVDIWASYGGGFTDLLPGASWVERFEYCRYPRPYSAYLDISTACSRYRLMVNCL